MTKVFEDYFSELQADMVSITLEYVENQADYIYIYCFCENDWLHFNFFYKVDSFIVHKSKLNEIGVDYLYDVSLERQEAALDIGISDLEKIQSICKEHNRDMPTEMKMIYNIKTGEFNAKYKYDLVCHGKEDLIPMDIFDQWFEEVSQQEALL